MPNYFAKNNRFVPPKNEIELKEQESLTGILLDSQLKPGNNESGIWLVFRIKTNIGVISAFFEPRELNDKELKRYESFNGQNIILKSLGGKPIIEINESIVKMLLQGVTSGHIKMEDLPALMEFAKGDTTIGTSKEYLSGPSNRDRLKAIIDKIQGIIKSGK